MRSLGLGGALVIAVGAAVLALTGGGGEKASAAGPTSYCEATLRALQYTGDDNDRFRELLDPVVALAPGEVAPTVRTLRAVEPGSRRYERARELWNYYNNNHCCQCLNGQYIPTIQEVGRDETPPTV